MQEELSKCKLDLIQQQEAWMVKEELHKEKEKARKEKEEECKAREHLFNQWECIQLNIRWLIRALSNETNDDFIVLHNIKNLLANILNFT